MPKPYLIVMCSPDRDRFSTRRALGSIKATDLSRAEFWLVDNNYDAAFRHPDVMNRALQVAAGRGQSVIFLDDDIEVATYDWIERLEQATKRSGADIIGCRHVWADGNTNHEGYWIDETGIVAPIIGAEHRFCEGAPGIAYVPSLCSALMLVHNPGDYSFDAGFAKYQQDLDICLQSWAADKPVVCILDLKIMHHAGSTGELHDNFAQRLQADSVYFSNKWRDFLTTLYNRNELEHLHDYMPGHNFWRTEYHKASLMKKTDSLEAESLFRRIANDCYDEKMRSGANYHLYRLTGELAPLRRCMSLNPCHRAARERLASESDQDIAHYKSCTHGHDCSRCVLGAK